MRTGPGVCHRGPSALRGGTWREGGRPVHTTTTVRCGLELGTGRPGLLPLGGGLSGAGLSGHPGLRRERGQAPREPRAQGLAGFGPAQASVLERHACL